MASSIAAFMERFRIIHQQVISEGPASSGFGAVDKLAREAVTVLEDEVHLLLHATARVSQLAYSALAIAIENARAFSEVGPNGAPAPGSGRLMLLTVLHRVPPKSTQGRRLGLDWMPPLPDGRPIPYAVDFLLTYEEAYGPLSKLRRLHQAFLHAHEEHGPTGINEVLTGMFGDCPRRSAFDITDGDDEKLSCLRFLPAYAASSDPEWFTDDQEMRRWQRQARRPFQDASSDSSWFHALAPAPYRSALLAGTDMVLRNRLIQWLQVGPLSLDTLKADLPGPTVYLEPFGDQKGVATWMRLTAQRSLDSYDQTIWPIANDQDRSFWRESFQRFETILSSLRCSAKVAPLVQDQEHLFLKKGSRRLHVVLGRNMAFENAPDGLPWDFQTRPELEKWMDLEKKIAENAGGLINSTFATLLQVPVESVT